MTILYYLDPSTYQYLPINDFAHIHTLGRYPRPPQTSRKKQIPPETVGEISQVSSSGFLGEIFEPIHWKKS